MKRFSLLTQDPNDIKRILVESGVAGRVITDGMRDVGDHFGFVWVRLTDFNCCGVRKMN